MSTKYNKKEKLCNRRETIIDVQEKHQERQKTTKQYNNYPQRQYSEQELDDLEAKLLELAIQQND